MKAVKREDQKGRKDAAKVEAWIAKMARGLQEYKTLARKAAK